MLFKKCKKVEIVVGMLAAVIMAAIVSACTSAPDKEIDVELTEEYSDKEIGIELTKEYSDTESISTDVEEPVETIAPNEIIYREMPMNRLLDYSQSEVKTAFGEPLKSGSGLMLYDDLTFFFDQKSDKMEAINIREPGVLSVYGYPEKNLKELGTFKIDSQDKKQCFKERAWC